jgi:hypothetical protein
LKDWIYKLNAFSKFVANGFEKYDFTCNNKLPNLTMTPEQFKKLLCVFAFSKESYDMAKLRKLKSADKLNYEFVESTVLWLCRIFDVYDVTCYNKNATAIMQYAGTKTMSM